MGYIYKITNKINGKMYIGKTLLEPPELRWEEHKHDLYRKRNDKRPFYKAMRKYGIDNFTFEVIDKADVNLEELEKYYINKYRTYVKFEDCNGYNSTLGGDGKPYLTLDEEEVITYHTTYAFNIAERTAKHFNVANKTIKKILKKYNIMWHSKKGFVKLRSYLNQGAIIQVDPTNSYVINMFSNCVEATTYMGRSPQYTGIASACSYRKSHKALGFYWYKENDLPPNIVKDDRLYNNSF